MNRNRFSKTLAAHIYGQIVTVATTVVAPSAIAAHLGATMFGYWATLNAIAQFFIFADFGLSTALGNHISLKNYQVKDVNSIIREIVPEVNRRLFLSFGFLSLAVAIFFIFDWHFESPTRIELALATLFFCFSSIFSSYLNIYSGILRYLGRNNYGIFVVNTVRVLELLVLLLFVNMGFSLLWVAIGGGCRAIIAYGLYKDGLNKLGPERCQLNINKNHWLIKTIENLKLVGKGFALVNLSQNIALQAPVIVISFFYGSISGGVFSVCRTISRFPSQPLTVIFSSLGPEFADLIIKRNIRTLKNLVIKSFALITSASIGVNLLIFYSLDFLQKYWLHNKLTIDKNILFILCISTFIYLVSTLFNQILGSINETREQGVLYSAMAVISFSLVMALALMKFDIYFIALSNLFCEFVILMVTILHVKNIDFDNY